jgi:hypothetical protein
VLRKKRPVGMRAAQVVLGDGVFGVALQIRFKCLRKIRQLRRCSTYHPLIVGCCLMLLEGYKGSEGGQGQ